MTEKKEGMLLKKKKKKKLAFHKQREKARSSRRFLGETVIFLPVTITQGHDVNNVGSVFICMCFYVSRVVCFCVCMWRGVCVCSTGEKKKKKKKKSRFIRFKAQ